MNAVGQIQVKGYGDNVEMQSYLISQEEYATLMTRPLEHWVCCKHNIMFCHSAIMDFYLGKTSLLYISFTLNRGWDKKKKKASRESSRDKA